MAEPVGEPVPLFEDPLSVLPPLPVPVSEPLKPPPPVSPLIPLPSEAVEESVAEAGIISNLPVSGLNL
jgi:hypothetical protein